MNFGNCAISDSDLLKYVQATGRDIELDRALGAASLYDFLQMAWHVVEPSTPFAAGWHVQAVCEHLEAVSLRQIQNLIVTIPPGCTKSITVSVVWPAWEWLKNPGIRFLCSSN